MHGVKFELRDIRKDGNATKVSMHHNEMQFSDARGAHTSADTLLGISQQCISTSMSEPTDPGHI
eukprot:scaffold218647_cov15-Prasinocladus_malaysianus.AAC.1